MEKKYEPFHAILFWETFTDQIDCFASCFTVCLVVFSLFTVKMEIWSLPPERTNKVVDTAIKGVSVPLLSVAGSVGSARWERTYGWTWQTDRCSVGSGSSMGAGATVTLWSITERPTTHWPSNWAPSRQTEQVWSAALYSQPPQWSEGRPWQGNDQM